MEYSALLAALLALLVGLAAGKAWERYKLHDGRWVDRRRQRESPNYIQGLNYLTTGQLDLAIEEFSRAARRESDVVEVTIVLGNLYREKGQVGRAIQTHQQLLQRPRLTKFEHACVLLCLGLDYKRGGFVDRALETFKEVLKLDPDNQQALLNLEKLYEDQHNWDEAYATRQRVANLSPPDQQGRHRQILAFLENELGQKALKQGEAAEARRRFDAAIELDPRTFPAYLNLGDLLLSQNKPGEAVAVWEKLVAVAPERAYLTFDRLASTYPRLGVPERFTELCRQLSAASPQEWRARLALFGQDHVVSSPAAIEPLFEALAINPHAITVHQAMWSALVEARLAPDLVKRYVDTTREAVFYQDPHICIRCRYRSNELLWQCPHCHEWNTFIEERITPAQDREETES